VAAWLEGEIEKMTSNANNILILILIF